VDRGVLNAARWTASGPWSETWFVTAADPGAGLGIWLRYAVDIKPDGLALPSLWGTYMDGTRAFALRNVYPPAAIRRSDPVAIGAAELTGSGCSGEVEAGGHALRWRLSFSPGRGPEDAVPAALRPVSVLLGSGLALPHPAMRVTGALEVDGKLVELVDAPGAQAHIWARQRLLTYTWARCNAFAEDPGASIDLTSVRLPGGVWVPLFTFRFHGEVHRFQDPPWLLFARSAPASPSWHFSASGARISLDGVVRGTRAASVLVGYEDARGDLHHCTNTELASMQVRVRTRAFPGAPWRAEATLTSRAACLEFCGPGADARVPNLLSTALARHELEGRPEAVAAG